MFIVLEGIDGSGITTHSRLLVEYLRNSGCNAVYTKEPTEGPIGRLIRGLLGGPSRVKPEVLALLFAADRMWHLYYDRSLPGVGIMGALSLGYIVVSDRYKYSSIAYQGLHLGFEWVEEINKFAIEPDVIIYLRVDPKIAWNRITRTRSRLEYFEAPDTLEKVQRAFDKIFSELSSRGHRIVVINEVIDGRELSVEETHNLILEHLNEVKGGRICRS